MYVFRCCCCYSSSILLREHTINECFWEKISCRFSMHIHRKVRDVTYTNTGQLTEWQSIKTYYIRRRLIWNTNEMDCMWSPCYSSSRSRSSSQQKVIWLECPMLRIYIHCTWGLNSGTMGKLEKSVLHLFDLKKNSYKKEKRRTHTFHRANEIDDVDRRLYVWSFFSCCSCCCCYCSLWSHRFEFLVVVNQPLSYIEWECVCVFVHAFHSFGSFTLSAKLICDTVRFFILLVATVAAAVAATLA